MLDLDIKYQESKYIHMFCVNISRRYHKIQNNNQQSIVESVK